MEIEKESCERHTLQMVNNLFTKQTRLIQNNKFSNFLNIF